MRQLWSGDPGQILAEGERPAILLDFLFSQGNRELMKKDAVLTLPLFLDLGARRKFARNLTQFGD